MNHTLKRIATVIIIQLAAKLAVAQARPLPQTPTAPEQTGVASEKQDGEALYQSACGVCHMLDGSGVPGMQPSIGRRNRVVGGEPATLVKLLLRGSAAALPARRERYVSQMPTFEALSDKEIAAVLSYVRRAFGNAAPAVTATRVAALRSKP